MVTQLMSWCLCNSQQLPYSATKPTVVDAAYSVSVIVVSFFFFWTLFFCFVFLLNMNKPMHTYSIKFTCYIRPQTSTVFKWNEQLTDGEFRCFASNSQNDT